MVSTTAPSQHAGLVVRGETSTDEPDKVRYAVGVRYSRFDDKGELRSDEQYILINPRHGRDTGSDHRHMPDSELTPGSANGEWHNIDGRAIVAPDPRND